MKIELKLTADEIFYLEKKLENVTKKTHAELVSFNRLRKNENSLLLDCLDKISVKSKSISRKPTIFDTKKKYSISFKYHEASILNAVCCTLKDIEIQESYFRALANSIFINIDKKL